jgi:hypothetical protein
MLPAAVLPLLLLSPLADELLDAFLLLVFLFPPVLPDFLLPPERPFGGSCALGPRWWWPEFPLGPGPCTDLRPKETQYNLPYCIQIKQNHNEVRDGWIDKVITRSKAKAVPLHSHGGAWEERKYRSNSFTTSSLDGGEWSASHSGRALPLGKWPPVPIVQEPGWAPEPV